MCARRSFEAVAAGAGLTLVLLAGCASPGPPLPPSLKLPEVVSGLTASRVGDEVRLRWTTPSRTTDKLLIAGPIEAEICRENLAAASATAVKGGQNAAPGARENVATAPCSPVVLRKRVTPGASEAVDALPAELTAAPARLLAYRVQLRNAAGRTAGASATVFAASGPAPQAVEDLRGKATKAGVVLEWKTATGEAETVELDRNIIQSPTAATSTTTATTAGSGAEHKGALPGTTKEPTESRFRSGSELVDAGGTIDRTAQIGHAYCYTAQRVRSVELGGQKLELRGVASAEVTVAVRNVFPPEAPVGLVAVPGFAGEPSVGQAPGQSAAQTGEHNMGRVGGQSPGQAGEQAQRPAIDLSWEPDLEPRIAGYRVYRRDLDGDAPAVWRRLDAELVPMAAYRDLSVMAGRRYGYRVTAVSEVGNESASSNEVVETAPAQ